MKNGSVKNWCLFRVIKEIPCFLWIMAPNASGVFQPVVLRWWLSWDGGAFVLGIISGNIKQEKEREEWGTSVFVCFQQRLWKHLCDTCEPGPGGFWWSLASGKAGFAAFGNKRCPYGEGHESSFVNKKRKMQLINWVWGGSSIKREKWNMYFIFDNA